MKRIVVLSDMQIPYHDKRAVKNVLTFIKDWKPDGVASVGDDLDFPMISRWTRGMAGEYAGDMQSHVQQGRAFYRRVRDVHDGPIDVMRSNHTDRPMNYLRQYAPGFMGYEALTFPAMMQFEQLGVTYHEEPWEIAPGWLLAHGDEGGQNRTPGGTALGLARRWGYSVVCGHTHKLGLQHDHDVVNGRITRHRYGFEVGNLMNMKEAGYLKAGSANWNQGFGLLLVDGRRVTPVPVVIHPNGTFTVDGTTYGV
ncbi:hypothetical protein [Streptomyces sp. DH10]|uniref:hypothetical protein n=1 Tax=Streptomyces sp. DH10 TaxID=3040121 RepID=UPI00244257B5|nr:hypothetical protein [Streptomyces sp. DH10]MDG9711133.1 hypothetical protein [Streptomyces sp. DH10]